MHGRLKVKSTAEQQEAKKKEREKKLQLYNGAMSKIFHKKTKGELDEEMLLLSAEILVVNPDVYTLWNLRKETFIEFEKSISEEQLQKMYQSELHFLEMCLKKSPKSYGSWHHRCFVMDQMPHPDWNNEIELCNQFLQYDERNFHCWDYRRFIVIRAKISPEAELKFSLNKINNNFSNYSSWHYRSKLLPILFPDPAQPMGVSEEALLKEYELVQNGFFTDPDDQSNWFYHRWLMGRGEQKQNVDFFFVSKEDKRVIVCLAQFIQAGDKAEIILECNGERLHVFLWLNQDKNSKPSTLWRADDVIFPQKDCDIRLSIKEDNIEVCSSSLFLQENVLHGSSVGLTSDGLSYFSQDMSPLKKETLLEALDSVSQLMEIEAENKWTVLAVILLMKSLDPMKYQDDIKHYLDKLEQIDPKRINYYKDLSSKLTVENILDGIDFKSTASLDLSGKKLTKMYHCELLPMITCLNLSNNCLKEVHSFNFLQNITVLNLGNNNIDNCQGLQHLPKLENLFLDNNNLSAPDDFLPLQHCVALKLLDISNNPLCCNELLLASIKEMFQNVNIIFIKS